MLRTWVVLMGTCTIGGLVQAESPFCLERPTKKLVSFGWDHPKLDQYAANLSKLEHAGFDGYGIGLPTSVGGGRNFRIDEWQAVTQDAKQAVLRAAADWPRSEKLTENFLVIYGESTMRWTNDDEWKVVEDQLRFCAKVAKQANLRGILWDAEPYGKHKTWQFREQTDRGDTDYFEYAKTLVRRGQQWVNVIQEEFPDVVILSLRQFSDFQAGSPFSAPLFTTPAEDDRKKIVRGAYWGLHIPFTVGILEGCRGKTVLHDGNEDAYYYTSALDFYRIGVQLRTLGRQLVPPQLRPKFDQHYRVGHAVSVDYTTGNWADGISFPNSLRRQALELSEPERAKWFEHNLYYALESSDEYVWVYTEPTSFWKDEKVPPGYHEAFRNGRTKHTLGNPLGFEVEAMLQAAQERVKQAEKKLAK